MTFFNTISDKGAELKADWAIAGRQEREIMTVFNRRKTELTPFEVVHGLFTDFGRAYPITSVRRAMTSLTKSGHLEKTDIQRMGEYGKKNYCWRIV